MSGFVGSDNKIVIRKNWDLQIVRKNVNWIGRPLTYFGLPGPKLKDILAWREYLGTCSGAERLRASGKDREEDLNIQRQLQNNISKYNITGFQLLQGDIEDIIIEGVDLNKIQPKCSSLGNPLTSKFCYDLINLDFYGGIGYRDKHGESKRIKAIKKLIERQSRTNFVLMLTLNVRDKLEDELDRYLQGTSKQLTQLHEVVEWYRNECGPGMREYKLKSVVPLFIRDEAEHAGFECFCYPPVVYEGDGKAKMIHFVFEMLGTKALLPAFSPQQESDVLNLAFLEARDNGLYMREKQHPYFDFRACEAQFGFLDDQQRISILNTFPNVVVGKQ